MSKNVKIFVVIATAMIAAGVILSVVGLALGGFKSVYFGSQGFYVADAPGMWGAQEVVSQRLDKFAGINIDVKAYTVTLQKGDAYGIEVKNRSMREMPYIHVADGVLTVREKEDVSRREGFFASWLSFLPLRVVHNDWEDALIEITYPSDARFDAVNIEAAAGNVDVVGLDAESLSVACAAGDLEIEHSKPGKLRVNLIAGRCEIENTRADDTTVELGAGSLSAENFECGGLRGDVRLGQVNVEGSLRGDVDISAGVGDVFIRTDLPKSEYRVDLDVALGNATVDGHTVSGGNAGIGGGDASAPYSIHVEASMGEAEIDFD